MRRKTDRLIWLILALVLTINLYVGVSVYKIASRFGDILDNAQKEADCMRKFGGVKQL